MHTLLNILTYHADLVLSSGWVSILPAYLAAKSAIVQEERGKLVGAPCAVVVVLQRESLADMELFASQDVGRFLWVHFLTTRKREREREREREAVQ